MKKEEMRKGKQGIYHQGYLEFFQESSCEKKITIQQLMTTFGESSRRVRTQIQYLRRAGFPICSGTGGDGYWLERDKERFEAFLVLYTRYAKTIIEYANNMRTFFDEGKDGAQSVDGKVDKTQNV